MRIDANLNEHRALVKRYEAYLDGVKQTRCFLADEEKGEIGRYTDPCKENGYEHIEYVKGKVELRLVEKFKP